MTTTTLTAPAISIEQTVDLLVEHGGIFHSDDRPTHRELTDLLHTLRSVTFPTPMTPYTDPLIDALTGGPGDPVRLYLEAERAADALECPPEYVPAAIGVAEALSTRLTDIANALAVSLVGLDDHTATLRAHRLVTLARTECRAAARMGTRLGTDAFTRRAYTLRQPVIAAYVTYNRHFASTREELPLAAGAFD